MARELTFKGKTLNEMLEMSTEEFARLVPSRQRRSLSRQKTKDLMKKIEKAFEDSKKGKAPKPVRTHSREAVIVPKMIGLRLAVHNGKEFINFEPAIEMLGRTLGEFSLTRKRLSHGKAGIGATKSSTAVATRK